MDPGHHLVAAPRGRSRDRVSSTARVITGRSYVMHVRYHGDVGRVEARCDEADPTLCLRVTA